MKAVKAFMSQNSGQDEGMYSYWCRKARPRGWPEVNPVHSA